MPFEYFSDYQSGQFDFIRIPRVMMTEEVICTSVHASQDYVRNAFGPNEALL